MHIARTHATHCVALSLNIISPTTLIHGCMHSRITNRIPSLHDVPRVYGINAYMYVRHVMLHVHVMMVCVRWEGGDADVGCVLVE